MKCQGFTLSGKQCSRNAQPGRTFCHQHPLKTTVKKKEPSLKTEDLGKVFEMTICMIYDTPFIGPYKYSYDEAKTLTKKMKNLPKFFPNLTHTAHKGSRYDFSFGKTKVSAKTNKKGGTKVCPQKIGQPTKKKFSEHFDCEMTKTKIKEFIVENKVSLLPEYEKHTFDCPILYYNTDRDTVSLIEQKHPIDWSNYNYTFTHQEKKHSWNEGTTLKLNGKAIGEFQIQKNRDCVKFRWYFENVLSLFRRNFKIVRL